MNKLNIVDIIAIILVVVGCLNWGLVGIFDFDVAAAIFGDMSIVARIIYVVVALAAIYVAAISMKLVKK